MANGRTADGPEFSATKQLVRPPSAETVPAAAGTVATLVAPVARTHQGGPGLTSLDTHPCDGRFARLTPAIPCRRWCRPRGICPPECARDYPRLRASWNP